MKVTHRGCLVHTYRVPLHRCYYFLESERVNSIPVQFWRATPEGILGEGSVCPRNTRHDTRKHPSNPEDPADRIDLYECRVHHPFSSGFLARMPRQGTLLLLAAHFF